jgi:hypothetical protein
MLDDFFEWGRSRVEKSERGERLWERSVDKKERLVQTYVVLYGMLISFGQYDYLIDARSVAVRWFFPFLVVVLVYYMVLSRMTYDGMYNDNSGWYGVCIMCMEVCSFFTSYFFSYAIVSYLVAVGFGDSYFGDFYSYFGFDFLFVLLTLVVFRSLSVVMFDGLYVLYDLMKWLYYFLFRAS